MDVFVLIARSSAARDARIMAAYEPAKSGSDDARISFVFIDHSN